MLAQMGGLAEKLLGQAMHSLEKRDPRLADFVVRTATARTCYRSILPGNFVFYLGSATSILTWIK